MTLEGDDDEDSDDSDNDSDNSDDDNDPTSPTGPSSTTNKPSHPKASNKKASGIREEMALLRTQLDTTDTNRIPQSGETLRVFYARTTLYWTGEAVNEWRARNEEEYTRTGSYLEPM